MFQYASLYGIAVRNGMTLVVRDDAELYDVFDYLYANKIKNDSFCDEAEYMEESEPCLYDEDAANIDSSQNIFHDSLLQSWRYFSDVEDDIRKQFRFRENIEILCQEIVNDAVMNWTFGKSHDMVNDLQIVGIHIRRGDYVSKKNIKYGYQTATPEYMNKSMNYFREKFQNVLFLAYTNPTSDDLLWRQNNVIGSDVIHMRMFTAEVDMCSLTKCNHSIITVGSFGWWAAWLANGLTIYYKDIARNGSEYRGDFSENMTDFFYPGWIGF
jgi:galactoside 2-L-fucosyltransferase 1/2